MFTYFVYTSMYLYSKAYFHKHAISLQAIVYMFMPRLQCCVCVGGVALLLLCFARVCVVGGCPCDVVIAHGDFALPCLVLPCKPM